MLFRCYKYERYTLSSIPVCESNDPIACSLAVELSKNWAYKIYSEMKLLTKHKQKIGILLFLFFNFLFGFPPSIGKNEVWQNSSFRETFIPGKSLGVETSCSLNGPITHFVFMETRLFKLTICGGNKMTLKARVEAI